MAEETKTNIQYLDMEGLALYDSLIKAKISSDIEASEYDDTSIKERISANETAVTVLNGEGEGSVKKQVSDAVALIVANAPEAYDTLKEISDWISSHAGDASSMNSQITANQTDITNLKALIGTLPEGTESSTIVTYIAEVVNLSKTDLNSAIATAKSEAVSAAASDATSKSNQSLADAKIYSDNAVKALQDGQVATNKTNIEAIQTKLDEFQPVTYTAITEAEINGLFTV